MSSIKCTLFGEKVFVSRSRFAGKTLRSQKRRRFLPRADDFGLRTEVDCTIV